MNGLPNDPDLRTLGGRQIEKLGARFAEPLGDPARPIVETGYSQLAQVSIIDRARELGAVAVPGWLLNTLLRSLRDGYRACIFEAAPTG